MTDYVCNICNFICNLEENYKEHAINHTLNLDNIEINNNVKLEELVDNKTWIHGKSKENIQITIFLITIEGYQLKYALKAINELSLDVNVMINIIMNICPTNKAYNLMRVRCLTPYFIQLDEDMELFKDSMKLVLKKYKRVDKKKVYVLCFYLIDDYLGVSDPPVIFGLKVYNYNIMKRYSTYKSGHQSVSSVDQLWQKQVNEDGYECKFMYDKIGYHAKHRLDFDLMLRYCKMIKSMLNPLIKEHRSDRMKLIRPMCKINNFNNIYMSIVSHFIKKGFNLDIFIKNNSILIKNLCYINKKSLDQYKIPHKYTKITESNNYMSDTSGILHNISLGDKCKNITDIYCILGIVNTLFENYEYNKNKYPYDIDEYFQKVFRLNVLIKDVEEYNRVFCILTDNEKRYIKIYKTETDEVPFNIVYEKNEKVDIDGLYTILK
jgi:hypothetical protein